MDAEPTTPAPQPAAPTPKAEPPKPAEKKSDEVSRVELKNASHLASDQTRVIAKWWQIFFTLSWFHVDTSMWEMKPNSISWSNNISFFFCCSPLRDDIQPF